MTQETQTFPVPAVKRFIDLEQARHDISLTANIHDINEFLAQHASLAVHYGELAAKAQSQTERFERLVKIVAAKLDGEIRKSIMEAGEKVTEPKVEAAVTMHKTMRLLQNALIEAREEQSLCDTYKFGFNGRKDTLIALAHNMRQERGGELALNQIEAQSQSRASRESAVKSALREPASA